MISTLCIGYDPLALASNKILWIHSARAFRGAFHYSSGMLTWRDMSKSIKLLEMISTQDSSRYCIVMYDGNGNVTDYVDINGSSVAHYEYGPFGEIVASSGSKKDSFTHRFSTKPVDADTGLVAYELRIYSAELGRFVSKDPIGESGFQVLLRGRTSRKRITERLYTFVGNHPGDSIDVIGLEECDYCGPDVTEFFLNLINSAIEWRAGFAASRFDGAMWFWKNGMNMDWSSSTGPYKACDSEGKTACPSGAKCANTYWLCGECVHDHWIGNFMYGFIGRLFFIPDWVMDAGGEWAQGDDVDEPSWDTAGYHISRNVYDMLKDESVPVMSLCDALKSDPKLWETANDTSAVGENYPKPHASGYKDCTKCPYTLSDDVANTVPGGKFGGEWPNP